MRDKHKKEEDLSSENINLLPEHMRAAEEKAKKSSGSKEKVYQLRSPKKQKRRRYFAWLPFFGGAHWEIKPEKDSHVQVTSPADQTAKVVHREGKEITPLEADRVDEFGGRGHSLEPIVDGKEKIADKKSRFKLPRLSLRRKKVKIPIPKTRLSSERASSPTMSTQRHYSLLEKEQDKRLSGITKEKDRDITKDTSPDHGIDPISSALSFGDSRFKEPKQKKRKQRSVPKWLDIFHLLGSFFGRQKKIKTSIKTTVSVMPERQTPPPPPKKVQPEESAQKKQETPQTPEAIAAVMDKMKDETLEQKKSKWPEWFNIFGLFKLLDRKKKPKKIKPKKEKKHKKDKEKESIIETPTVSPPPVPLPPKPSIDPKTPSITPIADSARFTQPPKDDQQPVKPTPLTPTPIDPLTEEMMKQKGFKWPKWLNIFGLFKFMNRKKKPKKIKPKKEKKHKKDKEKEPIIETPTVPPPPVPLPGQPSIDPKTPSLITPVPIDLKQKPGELDIVPPLKKEKKHKKDKKKLISDKDAKGTRLHVPTILGIDIPDASSVNLIPTKYALGRNFKEIGILLMIVLLLVVALDGAVYAGLNIWEQQIENQKTEVDEEIARYENDIEAFRSFEKEMTTLGDRISIINGLLERHIYWTNFFELLEKYTMPSVYYDGLSAGSTGSLNLSAHGDSFETVSKQLLLLQGDAAKEFVLEADVKGAQLTETAEGAKEVNFAIQITLNPKLFYYYAKEEE